MDRSSQSQAGPAVTNVWHEILRRRDEGNSPETENFSLTVHREASGKLSNLSEPWLPRVLNQGGGSHLTRSLWSSQAYDECLS